MAVFAIRHTISAIKSVKITNFFVRPTQETNFIIIIAYPDRSANNNMCNCWVVDIFYQTNFTVFKYLGSNTYVDLPF